MAILKFKKLIEDLENGTEQVLASVTKATSAGNAGTARVAHYASSGTANIAGTSAVWSTGGL